MKKKISINDFEILTLIGLGSFGKVVLAKKKRKTKSALLKG